MLVLSLHPGHDGAIAAIGDGKLLFSLEAEKDSHARHELINPTSFLLAVEQLDQVPDVVALTGSWRLPVWLRAMLPQRNLRLGAGYRGTEAIQHHPIELFGEQATFFTSSHERSHIFMAIGMAPRDEAPLRAVLVYEGLIGHFYLVDESWKILKEVKGLGGPGARYAFVYALADPSVPEQGALPGLDAAGKVMALAAYGDATTADADITDTVERILTIQPIWPAPKHEFRDSPVFNSGVTSDATKSAAALLTKRMFEVFAAAAEEHLPRDIPLYISGGCGLNCDWNTMWRDHGQFTSVFVPPVTNDSGSAIGTAIDAITVMGGEPFIDWNVYAGLGFEWDEEPDSARWRRRQLDNAALADALASSRIVAWVQGRWEIGPRALGARSILAQPFDPAIKDRLNEIKRREDYRPIAPCCRLEDVSKFFNDSHPDPYMLYFRTVRVDNLRAVTHVDGSARVQTVTDTENKPLHDLLTAFGERHGAGVLCNTSLNYKGAGFINRMSDLCHYSETTGIDDMVVGDVWFERV
jgi:hydroxymethyl cephem carbamoyltransferase